MKMLHMIAFILLVIGGLNWLLVVFGVDIATWISASWWQSIMTVVYVLVGLSAILEIFTHKKMCRNCETPSAPTPAV